MGKHGQIRMKQSAQDVVTDADKDCEALIRQSLSEQFPEFSFLGEEGVNPGPEASIHAIHEVNDAEYVWIVDPIDGTANFIQGFPMFSISIALAHRGEVVSGVVYAPCHNELFIAETGKGAFLNGVPLDVSHERRLADGIIATGYPTDLRYALPMNMKGLNALSTKARSTRIIGSAALNLAYLAAGRLSGFWEIGLNAWDVAAGVLLVCEAGGKVTDTRGGKYSLSVRNLLASNGMIHEEFVRELLAAEAAD